MMNREPFLATVHKSPTGCKTVNQTESFFGVKLWKLQKMPLLWLPVSFRKLLNFEMLEAWSHLTAVKPWLNKWAIGMIKSTLETPIEKYKKKR